MTVQQLKYILKVAEVGSITEAAKLLFISQPSLSNSIKETEKEAGITIFLRSRIGITLTNDGAEFLGYARQVIQQMELLEDRYVTNLPGKVTFGVSSQHYTFTENAFVELVKLQKVKQFRPGTTQRIYKPVLYTRSYFSLSKKGVFCETHPKHSF